MIDLISAYNDNDTKITGSAITAAVNSTERIFSLSRSKIVIGQCHYVLTVLEFSRDDIECVVFSGKDQTANHVLEFTVDNLISNRTLISKTISILRGLRWLRNYPMKL